jgi:hypothetical protein
MLNRRRLSFLVPAAAVGGFFLCSAFAAAPAQAAVSAEATPTGERLERALERLQEAEQVQQDNLDRSEDVKAKTEAWIDRLEDEGKDTAALRSALDAFLAGKAEAQSYHDEGAALLDRHAGFDSQGNMTDMDQARDTVLDARYHFREAHLTIAKTVMEFRYAVRDYRQSLQAAG